MEDMAQLVSNKIKQLFCIHNYETITNFYGDAINDMSAFSKKIIRSLQRCKKCGKLHKSEYLDRNCKVVNFDIIYENGNLRSVKNENNRTFN